MVTITKQYIELLELLEDIELIKLLEQRLDQPEIEVDIDEL